MIDIEEKLPEILAAEADRHELPVFSAERIAGNAARNGFRRRRKVALIAAIGVAGAAGGGGAVIAAAGHGGGDRVTVTFQQDPEMNLSAPPTSLNLDVVRGWVLGRAAAEGLDDVAVTVRRDPFAIVISGRASDTERLRMLGATRDLFVTHLATNHADKLPPERCLEKADIGPSMNICDVNGFVFSSFGSAQDDLKPAGAHAVRRRPGAEGWAVVVQLDAASAERYRDLTATAAEGHSRLAVLAGRIVITEPTVTVVVGDGVIESEAAFTEQQAKDLAVDLLTPSPPGYLPPLTPTVSPGPAD